MNEQKAKEVVKISEYSFQLENVIEAVEHLLRDYYYLWIEVDERGLLYSKDNLKVYEVIVKTLGNEFVVSGELTLSQLHNDIARASDFKNLRLTRNGMEQEANEREMLSMRSILGESLASHYMKYGGPSREHIAAGL